MSKTIKLKPYADEYSHGQDAMQAFLSGAWFEMAEGEAAGSHTHIDRYPAGTEFSILYMTVKNDWTFDKYFPCADRQFLITFRKPSAHIVKTYLQ